MAPESVDIYTRIHGAREAAREAKGLATGIEETGAAAKSSASGFRRSSQEATRHKKVLGSLRGRVGALTLSYREAAKGILAAGAAFASYEGIKKATETTVELGSTTLKLSRNLGLTTKAASEWAAVAHVRGIDTKALNMSFTTLSRNVGAARTQFGTYQQKLAGLGTSVADQKKKHDLLNTSVGKQYEAFKTLGIGQRDLTAGTRDFNGLIFKLAKGFGDLKGGTTRAALAQQLFGRGAQTIVPLFKQGSETIREQMNLADKYGATFGDTTTAKIKNFIAAQHEAEFAMLGLQVTIGTKVVPVITKVIGAFAKFTLGFRHGTGAGGRFRDQLTRIWNAAKPVVMWVGRATRNVIKFASHHGGIVKVAAALFLAGKALKALKFFSAIRGAMTLRSWLIKDAVVAEALPAKVAATSGAWAMAGRAIGIAFGAAIAAEAANAIQKWFTDQFGMPLPSLGGTPNPGGFNPKNWMNPYHGNGPAGPAPVDPRTGVVITPGFPASRPGSHPHRGRNNHGSHGFGPTGTGNHARKVNAGALAAVGGPDIYHTTEIHLDGKVLATATAKFTNADRNRR